MIDDRPALRLRDERRPAIAAGTTSPASSVTGSRLQARMERLIEQARRTHADGDGEVRARPDL